MGSYTLVGGTSGTSGSGTQSGNGANDAANFSSGSVYFATDFMSETPNNAAATGSGGAGYGVATPLGSVVIPAGYAASDLAGRPGIIFVQTAALNDFASFQCGTVSYVIYPTAPTHTLTIYFLTPKTASSASDRYNLSLGWFVPASGALPYHGYCLTYNDSVNSGNWVFYERASNATTTTVNTTFPFAVNTWHKFQLVITNKQLTGTITPSGGATTTLFSNTASVQLGTNNLPIPLQLGGLQMQRTAYTAGTIGAVVDYTSVYATGVSRQ